MPSTRPDDLSPQAFHISERQQWIEGFMVVFFWAGIFFLSLIQRTLDPHGHGSEAIAFRESDLLFATTEFILWLAVTPVVFQLAHAFSFERRHWVRDLLVHVLLALAISTIVDAVEHAMAVIIFFDLDVPRTFTGFRSGWRNLHFLDESTFYLVALAAGFARDYFLRFQAHQAEAALLRAHTSELQAQLAEARLQSLHNQINPHFLFNTLHSISSYLEADPRGARTMIARLSQLLRYTLENASREVPLEDEHRFLNDYLEIQRIRFGDRLQITMDFEEGLATALVPNLILQPLVENALRHGVDDMEEGARITVAARLSGRQLILSVTDNGPGCDPAAIQEGVGLRNTRERLVGLYGSNQTLTLHAPVSGGCEARITLPYHTGEDLYTAAVSD